MAISRFDPFRDLAVLQGRLVSRGAWVPPVDVYEQDGVLVLKAELPGLKREDIDVTVENDTLTIRGERKLDQDIKQDNVHRVERAFGSFSRAFSLAPKVDATKITAEYKDGLLAIRLPFREEAKPRSIKVDVAA
jgi:HSP20 family protein